MVDANGTVNTDIRDLYLGIYGALGAGQGTLFFSWYLLYFERF